jgi:hypothetical protein
MAVRGVSGAELSPDEGATIAALLEAQRRAIETADIDERFNRCHDEAQRRAQWVRQAKENASQGSR